MKTSILPLIILFQLPMFAQDTPSLTLSANAGHKGTNSTYGDTGLIDRMRPELLGAISAIVLPEGKVLKIYDGEDGEGQDMLRLEGPLRIDDLKTLPRLHGKGNWDDAIASFRVICTVVPDQQGSNAIAKY